MRMGFQLIFSLVFILVGCGIETDNDTPYTLSESEILSGVLEPPPQTAIEQEYDPDLTVKLFFLDRDNKIIAIDRQLQNKPSIQSALDALGEAPLVEEVNDYGALSTLLVGSNPRLIKNSAENVITIKVDDAADLRSRARQDPDSTTLIYTQIVCTVDYFQINEKEIKGVFIEDSEGPIPVRDNEVAPIDGPATVADFNFCISDDASNPER